jgi:hypothetical protein
MKTLLLALLGIVLLLFSAVLLRGVQADTKKEPLLRHVVLFKFKPDATPDQISEIVKAFQELPGKISQIRDFEWGTDNSPEKLSKGLTHCFFVTIASEADRDAYLPHPAHQAFVAKLKPILDDVTVVDYWVGR